MFNRVSTTHYRPLIWFVAGFGTFVFTRVGTYVSIALPLAAIFILRLSRSRKVSASILLLALGFPLAGIVSQMSFSGPIFGIVLGAIQLILKGLIFAIPFVLDRVLYKRVRGFATTLVLPVSAVAVYFVNSTFGFFQGTAHFYAYMSYGNHTMMQLLSLAGIWGIGFLIFWFAGVVNWVWEHHFDWREIRSGVALFASVALALVAYGAFRVSPMFYTYEGQTAKVATVLYDDHTPEDVLAMFEFREFSDLDTLMPTVEARIGHAAAAGAEIVALQEYGIMIPEEEEAALVERFTEMAVENDVYLCVNYIYLPPMRQESYEYTFGFIELPDEEEGRNKALLISDRGEVLIEYVKRHLPVLEGNYVLNSESDDVPVVDTPYGRIGVVICKDMEYSRFLRDAGRKGADIVIAPSSEAARALAITYSQMLRAVEYGFSFVRPCNHGMSVAIDSTGSVLGSMNSFTTPLETMYAHVPTKGRSTLYTRIGDLFAWFCCIALVALIGYGVTCSVAARRRARGERME